jgi:hypothetical protein
VRTDYVLIEKSLLVDHEYSVFGTYVESSKPKSPNDRELLQKGDNERTFVTTGLNERKLEGWEGFRAIAWIGGSVWFALSFLTGLLVHLRILK